MHGALGVSPVHRRRASAGRGVVCATVVCPLLGCTTGSFCCAGCGCVLLGQLCTAPSGPA
eukprot:scaffold128360_cov21-Tisochrysis_lutea.AAC.1